jgi:SAM-dependent methyltransferase
MIMQSRVPPYFDFLIERFHHGLANRFVHVGHWDDPLSLDACEPLRVEDIDRAVERLTEVLVEMADLHDGQRVLDVGCGFGGTVQHIDQRFGSMSLVGLNIDARQIDICRQLAALHQNELQWVDADACHLPFPDQSFDRVLCIEAMFHFVSRRTFFREVARVLRPGGILVASDIVLTESVLPAEVPRMRIEVPLRDGYGPWPDIWGEDADHRELGSAAGLSCTCLLDATSQTRPTHRFLVPDDAEAGGDAGDPLMRAAMMLKWLHDKDYLQYLYMRFDKPTSNAGGRAASALLPAEDQSES